MSGKRYADEFKIAAVGQVVDEGCSAAPGSSRLGITTKSLYERINRFGMQTDERRPLRTGR